MKITLKEEEVCEAIRTHLKDKGLSIPDKARFNYEFITGWSDFRVESKILEATVEYEGNI